VLDTKSPKYLEMAQGHISLSVPSEATQGWDLHLPNEVHARLNQAVWDEGRQARKDSNGNRRTH
jgi:hypothetical protein